LKYSQTHRRWKKIKLPTSEGLEKKEEGGREGSESYFPASGKER